MLEEIYFFRPSAEIFTLLNKHVLNKYMGTKANER